MKWLRGLCILLLPVFVTHSLYASEGADLIHIVAGNERRPSYGPGIYPLSGIATEKELFVNGIGLDHMGNFYIAGHIFLLRIEENGNISRIIGTIFGNSVADGATNESMGDGGLAINARLATPADVTVDGNGNIYVVDENKFVVRRVDTEGMITTVAGKARRQAFAGIGGDDGLATEAYMNRPSAVAVDKNGTLYIADTRNGRIRKVSTNGIITSIGGTGLATYPLTYVDGIGLLSLRDGTSALEAKIYPNDVAVDVVGNVYVADSRSHRILKIDTNGILTTIAGSGRTFTDGGGYSGDGGPATEALLNFPNSVALDANGNVYIGDSRNYCIRKVDTNGIITTVAGGGDGRQGSNGVPALSTRLSINDVEVDGAGNIYVAEEYAVWRVGVNEPGINVFAELYTFFHEIGSTQQTITIHNPGSGTLEAFSSETSGANAEHFRMTPSSLSIAPGDSQQVTITFEPRSVGTKESVLNIIHNAFTDTVKINLSGIAAPMMQVSDASLTLPSTNVGLTSQDTFRITNRNNLKSISVNALRIEGVDAQDFRVSPANLSIAPKDSAQVIVTFSPTTEGDKNAMLIVDHDAIDDSVSLPLHSRVAPNGSSFINTFAGMGRSGSFGDLDPAINARLSSPIDVAVDAVGSVYIADWGNNRIRKVDTNGIITTFAGGRSNVPDLGDGEPAARASLNRPYGVSTDDQGNVFIADTNNHRIRKVNTQGVITTYAGSDDTEAFFGDGGPAIEASFNTPIDVTVDADGNVYIADFRNHRIRKVDTTGIITTIAGSGAVGGSAGRFDGDGGLATQARLNFPSGVDIDRQGNIYIVDSGNARIRKIGTDGIISTVVGTGERTLSGVDGPASFASLSPNSIALDASDDLYISAHNRVFKVGADGILISVAGTGDVGFVGNGEPALLAKFDGLGGIAVGREGHIYLADSNNNRIRVIESPPQVNRPPVILYTLDDRTLSVGKTHIVHTFGVDPRFFEDPDGDRVITWINTSNSDIAYGSTVDGALQIVTRGLGTVTITVEGDDRQNERVAFSFTVTVVEKQVIVGDFNDDGAVGFPDFLQFAQEFGKKDGDEGFNALYDLDEDASVGFGDFLIFAQAFGNSVQE